MTADSAIFLILMFVAFSMESKIEVDTLLEISRELEQRAKALQKREQHVKATEKKLQLLFSMLASFSLHENDEKTILKLKQELNDLAADLQQHLEKCVKAAEKMLKEREKELQAREEKLQKEQEIFYVEKESLKEQWLEKFFDREIKITDKQLNKDEITHPLNVHENPVSIRKIETNEICWSLDPKKKKDNKVSFELFDSISTPFWNFQLPAEISLNLVPAEHIDIDKRDVRNRTPLMIAATFDADKLMVKLIERGAHLEAVDEYGWTALHFAVRNGCHASCTVLLQKGANVNAQSEFCGTSLMFAARGENVKIVKLLLQSGADIKIKDNSGKNALAYAARNCADVIQKYKQSLKK